MHTVLQVGAFAGGLLVVLGVFGSAVRTTVLPRGVSSRLGRLVFVSMRIAFKLRIHRSTSYANRDRILAAYAPLALLALLQVWLLGVLGGFTAMLWGVGEGGWGAVLRLSGSSMLTLGFSAPAGWAATLLSFSEAALGLLLLALLITFLPTLYAGFHTREHAVAKLTVRAGRPPTGVGMLVRLAALNRMDYRREIWIEWESWFAEVEETHTSFPALAFFRSPLPDLSWVTAAGAVLDGAALALSCLAGERDLEAQLCLRAGFLCLRRIASIYRLPFDPDPQPTDRISVVRDEFDDAWARLADAGLSLRDSPDLAWPDFAGWRVNYDTVLIRLAALTEAPIAPWSSDRGLVEGHALTFIERIRQ